MIISYEKFITITLYTTNTIILLVLIYFTNACTSESPEIKNYRKCVRLLDEERKNARKSKSFSYSPQRFLECRAPIHYSTSS